MKKVITALQNEIVNKKLRQYNEIEVVINDIQYQEGIIEVLEIETKIDFIIISELLPGELNLKELINKIKKINNKINLIIILENENKELENYLESQINIYFFYNNKIKIEEIAKIIINNNLNKIEKEINELKEIIKNNNSEIIQNNNTINLSDEEIKKIENQIQEEYQTKKNKIKNKKIFEKNKIKNNSEIVLIAGKRGSGKSIFITNIIKYFEKFKNNILIIEINNNPNIQLLFGLKNNFNENKINKKINYLYINEKDEIFKKINILKNKYDFIMIEINNYENIKKIEMLTNKIIFLCEANILEIKNSKKIIDIYLKELKINKEKINILINKYGAESIDIDIVKEIFNNINIIGKINFIKNYNILINQKMNSIYLENRIKNQYKKIAKNILKNKNEKQYYLNKIKE